MRYRQLGKWGVSVSEVALGSWLTYGGTVAEDAAAACIAHAYDAGINFFDTANVYARGRSEEVVGAALAGYERSSFVLATKVYFPMGEGPNDSGLSRKHVTEQLHTSLRRLDTDYVDLYQCHRYDETTPLEETCAVMNDLVRAGKVLYWGVSEWEAAQIDAAVELCQERGWSVPVSNQPQYNALYRRIEGGVVQSCAHHGLGNVVWSPLAMGVLTGKYAPGGELPAGSRATTEAGGFMGAYLDNDVLVAVADACEVAREAGIEPATMALAWCLREPQVSSVIVGATRPEQLDASIAAGTVEVPADALAAYDEALAPVQIGAVLR